jgi:alternative ribosome-rescue factor
LATAGTPPHETARSRSPYKQSIGLTPANPAQCSLQCPNTGTAFMSKKPNKQGHNKAKSIVAQPLFRCRQERPEKGKGSYRREAFQSRDWEASYFLAA